MARAGVFGMVAPPTSGGAPVDVAVMLEVIEACAVASGSAGWCAMIGSTSAVSGAYLPPTAAAEIFADPMTIVGGVFAPTGSARPIEGGYRLQRSLVVGIGKPALPVARGWVPSSRTRMGVRSEPPCSTCPPTTSDRPQLGRDGAARDRKPRPAGRRCVRSRRPLRAPHRRAGSRRADLPVPGVRSPRGRHRLGVAGRGAIGHRHLCRAGGRQGAHRPSSTTRRSGHGDRRRRQGRSQPAGGPGFRFAASWPTPRPRRPPETSPSAADRIAAGGHPRGPDRRLGGRRDVPAGRRDGGAQRLSPGSAAGRRSCRHPAPDGRPGHLGAVRRILLGVEAETSML